MAGLFLLVALTLQASPSQALITTGTYTGDGNDARQITGLGFQPSVVIIKGQVVESAIISTSRMPAGSSKHLDQEEGYLPDAIQGFIPDGFQISSSNGVNQQDVTYWYVAMVDEPGNLITGNYMGDGTDNRLVDGLGLDPAMVLLIPGNLARCRFRTQDMPDGESLALGNLAVESGILSSLTTDGFRVSSDWQANDSGVEYTYLAVAQDGGYANVGSYVGDASSNRVINDAGFHPLWMFTKSAGTAQAAHMTDELSGDNQTMAFMPELNFADGIKNFVGQGFTLGAHPRVNAVDETYYWVAFDDGGDLADLEVSLVADTTTPGLGDSVTLTATMHNLGPADALNSILQVNIPAGLTLESVTPDAGFTDDQSSPTTLHYQYDIPTGEQRQVVAVFTVETGASTRQFSALASSAIQADPDPANDTVALELTIPTADLGLALTPDNPNTAPGTTLNLTLDLANNGPDDAGNTTVDFTVPAGLTLTSGSPSTGSFDVGSGQWTLPSLASGGTAALDIEVLVGNDQGGASLNLVADLTSNLNDDDQANNSTSALVDVALSFDLAVAAAFTPPATDAGDTVVLAITVANIGLGDAPGQSTSIPLPASLTLIEHDADAGSYDPDTDIWLNPATLTPGADVTLNLRCFSADDGEGVIAATATLSDLPGDGDLANNTATGNLVLTSVADLAVATSFNPLSAWPGDSTTLTVTVSCNGPGSATGFVLDLSLPAGLTLQGFDADQGAYDPGSGIWTVTEAQPFGSIQQLNLDLVVADGASGDLVATASAADAGSTDPMPSNDTAEASLSIGEPSTITVEVQEFDLQHRTLLPGGASDDVLHLRLINGSDHAEPLTSLVIHNPAINGIDQATQDAYWSHVSLQTGDGLELAAGSFNDGRLEASGLEMSIAPHDTVHLMVRGAAALDAPDGASLQPTMLDAADLVFANPVTIGGNWPLVATGNLVIDGMTAAQITLNAVGADVFQMDSVRNLALDVTLPPNGSETDHLIRLNVVNQGTAANGQEITGVEAWADDGDGHFDAAADTRLSELHWTGGSRYEASSLWHPIGLAGLRVFVTVDIAADALGGTVRLSLPTGDDVGVGVASGNDGPVDMEVVNTYAQTISSTDKIIVTTAPLLARVLSPGDDRVPLLHLAARNLYDQSRTLRRLRVRNVTTGEPGATQADLDAAIAGLVIQRDGNGNGILDEPTFDPIIATTTWVDGVATFEGLQWQLDPGEVADLFLTANLADLGPADGDSIGAMIGSASDLGFAESSALVGAWPLDSGARYPVDGMVAQQIHCPAVPPVALTANEGPILAFDMTIPSNGYLEDTLTSLWLKNLGSALPLDIAALELWADEGDGLFDPDNDTALGALVGAEQDWFAPNLDLPIPLGGQRLFVGLTVVASPRDSTTVRLSIPVDGLVMASSNDGPRDLSVENTTSLLISTAPLLSTLAFGQPQSTTEMTVPLTMTVTNVGGEDVETITPRDFALAGDGNLIVISGPEPASLDIANGESGTFTWMVAGQDMGPVYALGRCEGLGAVGGLPRGSLTTASANHQVLEPAVDLGLYPVTNMPFTINRGQEDLVPLALTLFNDSDQNHADLRLDELVITLDDGEGNPIIPADLLSRVTLHEGVNVYHDNAAPEASGQTLTLALSPPVTVTSSEPVSLSLRLSINDETSVERFRVNLLSAADITVVDNLSNQPRGVQLVESNFPVSSSASNIVAQATNLTVSCAPLADQTASAGQADVELLGLLLTSQGDDSGSEVKVGSFTVSVTDTLGNRLPDAAERLSRLWVQGPLVIHAIDDLTDLDDGVMVFDLAPQISVPVGSPALPITIHGRLQDDPILGPLTLSLEPSSTFDARDANTATAVPVIYDPDSIIGPVVTLQVPAPSLIVDVQAQFPPVIAQGAIDVAAITFSLDHPGTVGTAAVLLDTLRLVCLDAQRQPTDADSVFDGLHLTLDGQALSTPVLYDGHRLALPLGEQLLAAGQQASLALRIDIEAGAPIGGFELIASDTCLATRDANLNTQVPLQAAPGSALPASSGLTRLQLASSEVIAGWVDRLPPLLPSDGSLTEAAHLTIMNPAPVGAAPLVLSTLTLHTADRMGTQLLAGAMLSGAAIRVGESTWASLDQVALTDSTIVLHADDQPLELHAGDQQKLVIMVAARHGASGDGLSLGVTESDLIATQPGSTQPVLVRAEGGTTFPFWTAAAGLGAAGLEESYINFPNPFAAGREQTQFAFNLPRAGQVSLRIWTPRGEPVVTLLQDRSMNDGLHQDLTWDGRNGRGDPVRNGVYLAELTVDYDDGSQARLLRKVAVVR